MNRKNKLILMGQMLLFLILSDFFAFLGGLMYPRGTNLLWMYEWYRIEASACV